MMIVQVSQLQEWLQITRRPLYQWNKDGILPCRQNGSYDSEVIDAFLAQYMRNFTYVPTAEYFASQDIVLVDLSTVMQTLEVDRPYARYIVQTYLPHIQFPGKSGAFRVSLRELKALAEQMRDSMSAELVGSAIGVTRQTVVRFVGRGELVRVPAPQGQSQKKIYVSGQSARSFLCRHLPAWIAVNDWIIACRQPDFGLVPFGQAVEMLGISRRTAFDQLNACRAWYVTSDIAGRNVYVLLPWITGQLAQETPFTAEDIGRMFSVEESTVQAWLDAGGLECPIEGHPHPLEAPYLLRPCWLTYFRRNCSPGYERAALHFVDWRRTKAWSPPLFTLEEAAEQWGHKAGWLKRRAASGKLRGIKSPDGVWRFEYGQARKLRR